MQSLSKNPVKWERQKVYVIYIKTLLKQIFAVILFLSMIVIYTLDDYSVLYLLIFKLI